MSSLLGIVLLAAFVIVWVALSDFITAYVLKKFDQKVTDQTKKRLLQKCDDSNCTNCNQKVENESN